MGTIDITDLYQAAYLLLCGCELNGVECIPVGGALACRLTFSGAGLEAALEEYFRKAACVNLFAFRQAYNQVNGYVHQAKKSHNVRQRAGGAS